MAAIFGLGELLFLAIEVIGNLLFGKRRKRPRPSGEHPPPLDSHTDSVRSQSPVNK